MSQISSTMPPATPRQTNWAVIFRVGLVASLVLGLVGFALYESFVIIWKGGVVNKGNYYEVDLKSMSNFELDQARGTLEDIPKIYRELDGKKVLLEGEIAPASTTAGAKVDEFLLCYSVAKCCVGGPPKVQHFVTCATPKDKPVPNLYGMGQVKVFGTLRVKIIKEAGALVSIYQMDVERVEPVS